MYFLCTLYLTYFCATDKQNKDHTINTQRALDITCLSKLFHSGMCTVCPHFSAVSLHLFALLRAVCIFPHLFFRSYLQCLKYEFFLDNSSELAPTLSPQNITLTHQRRTLQYIPLPMDCSLHGFLQTIDICPHGVCVCPHCVYIFTNCF